MEIFSNEHTMLQTPSIPRWCMDLLSRYMDNIENRTTFDISADMQYISIRCSNGESSLHCLKSYFCDWSVCVDLCLDDAAFGVERRCGHVITKVALPRVPQVWRMAKHIVITTSKFCLVLSSLSNLPIRPVWYNLCLCKQTNKKTNQVTEDRIQKHTCTTVDVLTHPGSDALCSATTARSTVKHGREAYGIPWYPF